MKISVHHKQFNVVDSIPNHQKHWEYVNNGTWEPRTYEIFNQFLDKNYSYIDLGAWIGSTVLYGCQLCKHVYAVEPDIIALDALTDNIKVNPSLNNISLYNGAISDICGEAILGAPGGKHQLGFSASSLFTKKIIQTNKIETITFNDFINKYNIVDCNFIKMDIEGAEGIVLPTMKDYFKEHRTTLLMSLHPKFFNREDKLALIEVLASFKTIYAARTKTVIKPEQIFKVKEVLALWK